ncbi:hypothetical protein [uncultured Pontibacter sp.]|uniref:hypothetical protein n=1 Tax=uncultured Pontibacter sp. TaxID=453356 RepID=UPI002622D9ED|nr:hypothetical protein [uncultured Pontibacter sp.]
MKQITVAWCTKTTTHCSSGQRVWGVLIFLLTFFIKEKSKARLAKPSYKSNLVAKTTAVATPAQCKLHS